MIIGRSVRVRAAVGAMAVVALGQGTAAGDGLAVTSRLGPPVATTRVSVASDGAEGNDSSFNAAVSARGRYVAFSSDARNLVAGDTNGATDVFVRDRAAEVTELVSVGPAGAPADRENFNPSISADGRYVAFWSGASNLVAGDTNHRLDVFVRDRVAQVTERVSVGPAGAQANGGSSEPSISADGRHVAFSSTANNLVADDTNHSADVFVWNRVADSTRRVSVGRGGAQANGDSFQPSISADGRYVAFYPEARNLVADDTNHSSDVFVRDRVAHVTRRVSVGRRGTQANGFSSGPTISANGRYVAFYSPATNLVAGDTNHSYDVFVRDRVAHVTRRVSVGRRGAQANNDTFQPSISANGRYVAFSSAAKNLVAGDTNHRADVFVRDRVAHVTRRVSVGPGGAQANSDSYEQAISANGRYVPFLSYATNLVAGDTNNTSDVFLRGPLR